MADPTPYTFRSVSFSRRARFYPSLFLFAAAAHEFVQTLNANMMPFSSFLLFVLTFDGREIELCGPPSFFSPFPITTPLFPSLPLSSPREGPNMAADARIFPLCSRAGYSHSPLLYEFSVLPIFFDDCCPSNPFLFASCFGAFFFCESFVA